MTTFKLLSPGNFPLSVASGELCDDQRDKVEVINKLRLQT